MELKGTKSLITGGSSGIGLAVAHRLILEGGTVHSFDVQPPFLSVDGLIPHTVDVRDHEQVARGMADIQGKLQLLFNNAGVLTRGRLFDVSPAALQTMLDVNVRGSWLTLKTALDQNKLDKEATILQMCSTVGGPPGRRTVAPMVGAYSLTKQCVHEMIQALRSQRPDLRVKGVYPGAVKTPMTMAGFTEREYDQQALQQWGVVSTADDVAENIMVLLASGADNLEWDPLRKQYMLEWLRTDL